MAQTIIRTNDINIIVYESTTEKYHATQSKASTTLLFHSGYLCGSAVVLAPMEGVTNIVFRRLMRKIGGMGLTYTEFIPSRGIIENSKQFSSNGRIDKEESPIAIQIYGNKPDMMAHAAQLFKIWVLILSIST